MNRSEIFLKMVESNSWEEYAKQHLHMAIISRNVEPDGYIYIQGARVLPTPENTEKSIKKAQERAKERGSEAKIKAWKQLIANGEGDDVAKVREICGYRDSHLVTAQQGVAQEEDSIRDTEEYIKDRKLAGEVYQKWLASQTVMRR